MGLLHGISQFDGVIRWDRFCKKKAQLDIMLWESRYQVVTVKILLF